MDGVNSDRTNVAQNEAFLSPATASNDSSSDQCAEQSRWVHALQTKTNDKMPTIAKITANKGPGTMEKAKGRRSSKKIVYNTIEQKLQIIHEYKHLTKSGAKEQYAKSLGVSQSTITRWVQREKDFLKAKEQGRGKKKATYEKDGLIRIKLDLMTFYELNEKMPDALKLPITANLISTQALKIKDHLLKLHNEQKLSKPLVADEEKDLVKFTGSRSWAMKFIVEKGWKSDTVRG